MSDTAPTMTLETETVAELPKQERGERSGQYADLIRPAAADRQPKRSTFPAGVSKEDAESFRRALTHSANTMGYGCSSVVKPVDAAGNIVAEGTEGARLALFWQIKDKRVVTRSADGGKVEGSGQSTPDPAGGTADTAGAASGSPKGKGK